MLKIKLIYKTLSSFFIGHIRPILTQKGFIKLSKSLLVTYLIIFFAFSSIAGLFLFNPFGTKTTEAAWFNDNWGYRKTLTFTHNASVSTPSQVEFDIDTTAAPDSFQADCGDVRFTSPNGDILPYYYPGTDACDNASTDFDVLIPTIINGSNYIYMYYGNPSAQNGTKAADFSESTTTPSGGAASAGSEEKGPSPVAYWKFDDGQGSTTQDISTNNNDGTITGALWKTEDLCVSGKCLWFDGTNDSVNVADSSSIDYGSTGFTVSAWIRASSTLGNSTSREIVTRHNPSSLDNTQWYLRLRDSGASCSHSTTGVEGGLVFGYAPSNGNEICDNTALDDDKWHFVAVTRSVSGSDATYTLFVDGQQKQTGVIGFVHDKNGTTPLRIGNTENDANDFGGFIDEVKNYNYALTAAQIKANYNARSNPEGVSAAMGANITNMPGALSNGLVGYWKMDESSSTAADSSGNTNTLTNNATTAYAGAKFANGADFEATTTNQALYRTDANQVGLDITGSITISTWIKMESNGGSHFILHKGRSSGQRAYELFYQTTPCFNLSNDGTSTSSVCSDNGLSTGVWYHFVAVYDGTIQRLYINGVLDKSTNYSGGIHNSNGEFGIGSYVGLSEGDNFGAEFDGLIDEARVYNRALSSAEISQLYNWAPGPVGYWKMDEGSGTTSYDSSGNGNNSTNGGNTWKNGKYGKASDFAGVTTDYVRLPDSTDLRMNQAKSMTFEAWVKVDSLSSNRTIIRYDDIDDLDGDQTDPRNLYLFRVDSSGQVGFQYGASSGTISELLTSPVVSTGTWYHLVAVRDVGTDTEKIYVNGVLNTSETDTTTGTWETTGQYPLIGRFDNPANVTSEFFDGLIDDVKVYNYARTPAQIVEDMNAGHPAPGSPVGSAVAHWKLDTGYGTTGNDSTPNDNDLTMSTASWTNAGKFAKAWNGTGAVWMSRATDADLEFAAADSFSVSLWYKSDSATNPANGTEYLVSDSTGNTDVGFQIYAKTDGTVCFGIDDDGTWTDVESCSTTDLYDGTWHHLTAVRDTVADTTRLYIDAISRDSDTDPTTGTLDGNNTFYIGDFDGDNNATAGTEEFAGDIDEVKVYRSALTADQVKIDMNQSSGQSVGTLSSTQSAPNAAASIYCIPGSSDTCTGPVGEWNLDEGSGTSANDSSGNANTGTITAGAGKYINAKINKGYEFDNANTVIDAGSGSTLDNLGVADGLTFEAWIYPRSRGENNFAFIAAKNTGQSQTSGGWLFLINGISGNQVGLEFVVDYSSADLVRDSVTTAVTLNQWNHVALIWPGSTAASNVHMYVNGKEVSSYVTTTNGSGSRSSDAAASLWIGNASNQGSTFDGYIDDVKVFAYDRTPAQIFYDYNRGKPLAHWKMDECQGTTINDISGNSFTGTLTNATAGTCTTSGAWFNGVSGKRNYSVDLDTDDYIQVSDNFHLRFDDTVWDFSLFAWVKRASNGVMEVINKEDADNDGYRLQFTSGNVVRCSVDAIDIDSTLTITDTNWHHVGCTIDRDGNGQVYIDGQANGSATAISSEAMATTANLRLGARAYTTTNYLDGLIDDVRIYNYPLTATQIKTLFNEGAARYGPVTGAP